jgi:hypothetical protein
MCGFYFHADFDGDNNLAITVFDINMQKVSETRHDISKYGDHMAITTTPRYVILCTNKFVVVFDAVIPEHRGELKTDSIDIYSILPFADKFGVVEKNCMTVYDFVTLKQLQIIDIDSRRSSVAAWGDDSYICVHTEPHSLNSSVTICHLDGNTEHFADIGQISNWEVMGSSVANGFGNIRRIGKFLYNIETGEFARFNLDDVEFHGGLIVAPKDIDFSPFFVRHENAPDYWVVARFKPAEMQIAPVELENV